MEKKKERTESETICWITHTDAASAGCYIRYCISIDTLRKALKEERELKNRRTVCAMLERRLKKLGAPSSVTNPSRPVAAHQPKED